MLLLFVEPNKINICAVFSKKKSTLFSCSVTFEDLLQKQELLKALLTLRLELNAYPFKIQRDAFLLAVEAFKSELHTRKYSINVFIYLGTVLLIFSFWGGQKHWQNVLNSNYNQQTNEIQLQFYLFTKLFCHEKPLITNEQMQHQALSMWKIKNSNSTMWQWLQRNGSLLTGRTSSTAQQFQYFIVLLCNKVFNQHASFYRFYVIHCKQRLKVKLSVTNLAFLPSAKASCSTCSFTLLLK